MSLAVHTNAGRVDGGAEGLAEGLAVGVATGVGVADALGVTPGVAVVTGLGPMGAGRRLSGLATKSTPTMSAAMMHAATAAIQYGPRASGAWAIDDLTRSGSAGLGSPLMLSKTRFRSPRKFWSVTSEHLLRREVCAQPLRSAIDSGLGGRRRDAHRASDLVEWQVEIEVEDQRQTLLGT